MRVETPEIPVNLYESLLAGILGILAVAKDVHGQGHDLGFIDIHDFPERLPIALKAGRDQFVLSH